MSHLIIFLHELFLSNMQLSAWCHRINLSASLYSKDSWISRTTLWYIRWFLEWTVVVIHEHERNDWFFYYESCDRQCWIVIDSTIFPLQEHCIGFHLYSTFVSSIKNFHERNGITVQEFSIVIKSLNWIHFLAMTNYFGFSMPLESI